MRGPKTAERKSADLDLLSQTIATLSKASRIADAKRFGMLDLYAQKYEGVIVELDNV